MKTIDPGHAYLLSDGSPLGFLKKVRRTADGKFEIVQDGTTTEEVLEVVLDRLRFLNRGALPCRENSLAITHLEEALMWLEDRTKSRKAQGVEGTDKPHDPVIQMGGAFTVSKDPDPAA